MPPLMAGLIPPIVRTLLPRVCPKSGLGSGERISFARRSVIPPARLSGRIDFRQARKKRTVYATLPSKSYS